MFLIMFRSFHDVSSFLTIFMIVHHFHDFPQISSSFTFLFFILLHILIFGIIVMIFKNILMFFMIFPHILCGVLVGDAVARRPSSSSSIATFRVVPQIDSNRI